MNCLCCGKPLHGDEPSGWHRRCIRKFFGTAVIPKIDFDDETLEQMAAENVRKGLTVPGVQKKLSLHLFTENRKPRMTIQDYPAGYILKPQVRAFPSMPEAEQLTMCMADSCGISTVPHALLLSGGSYAYITRRVDRIPDGNTVRCLAMEDFCQLDLRLTQDKYKGSYERCAKIIRRYSSRPMLDLAELFIRLVFCYMTGNSDMHLKNFSLIEADGGYVLSPAYDLLPVNVIMPEDQETFALTMNGKKTRIGKKDFLVFAESAGISRKAAEKMIDRLKSEKEHLIAMCRESLLPEDLKDSFAALIEQRCMQL